MAALEHKLIKAVQDGDITEVRTLIEKGANINVFTSGRTPLGIAARQGNVAMLELLINCGHFKKKCDVKETHYTKKKANKNETARINERSKIKKRKATEGNNGYYEIIYDDKLDEKQSDVNRNVSLDEVETPEGMEKLEWDMELEGDVECTESGDVWSDQYRWYAKILANTCPVVTLSDLPYSCDVNLQDSVGRTAIHYASESGHVNAVKLLINAGCKADVGDVDSLTPLHLAATGGHADVVQTLLLSGASVNAKTTDKLSPLHYAAVRGFPEVAKVLLDAGANVDSLDEGEKTPLILAVSRNREEMARLLVERGARVNIEDVKGYTAMCEAVWHKSVPMAQLLLNAGAKVVPTHYLLHYAVFHRHLEMVSTLLSAGALVNIRDSSGDTPLILAAASGQLEMVQLLLASGAGADLSGGSSEKTPLYCCVTMAASPSPAVLMALVEGGAYLERTTWGHTSLHAAILSGKVRGALTLVSLGAALTSQGLSYIRTINSTLLARAYVLAGYDLREEEDVVPPQSWPVNTDNVEGLLRHAKYNPLRLSELCRIAVRKEGVSNPAALPLSVWTRTLLIPPVIYRYLMMEELEEEEDVEGELLNRWTNRFRGFQMNFNFSVDLSFFSEEEE